MSTRCIDGRRWRHDPQPDDPSLETDIGECEECRGKGCDADMEAIVAGCYPLAHPIGPSRTIDWTFAMTEEGHAVLNETGMTPRQLQAKLEAMCALLESAQALLSIENARISTGAFKPNKAALLVIESARAAIAKAVGE